MFLFIYIFIYLVFLLYYKNIADMTKLTLQISGQRFNHCNMNVQYPFAISAYAYALVNHINTPILTELSMV